MLLFISASTLPRIFLLLRRKHSYARDLAPSWFSSMQVSFATFLPIIALLCSSHWLSFEMLSWMKDQERSLPWRASERCGKPVKQIYLYFRSPHQTGGHWPYGILQAKTQTLWRPSMDQMLKHNTVPNIKSVYMETGWMGGGWALLTTVWCLSAQGTRRESSCLSVNDNNDCDYPSC